MNLLLGSGLLAIMIAGATPTTAPPTPPPTPPAPQTPDWTPGPAHARRLVSLIGSPDSIARYLAESFEFREVEPPGPPQNKAQFLAGMIRMAQDYTEMRLNVDSVVTHRSDSLEARGRFSALYRQRTRFDLHFAITMRFDASGRVDRWWDHFRQQPF